ncbi:MAG: deoxyribonuclease IV [Phycisphaerales bacterium]|nr:MAG: deoxyribonuclease IV [Phycisphaerales bacterium]
MFGSHLSIAGGMVNALEKAQQFKMDCVQVFTKNQRQWGVRPLDPAERADWLSKLKELTWHRKRGPRRVVSHNSYLINLASPDSEVWVKSLALQRVEIERCEELSIPLCVGHPGAHLGRAPKAGSPHQLGGEPGRDELEGLKRIARALDQIHRDLPGYRTITCLETTAGSGSNLGYDFRHLAWLRANIAQPERVGFCFDTCHVTAAGYDMTTDMKADAVLGEWDEICGLGNLLAFHLNDSMGEVGSRKDRHAHIGDGNCGRPCFRAIVNRQAFKNVPKILETPKGVDDRGLEWDLVNLRRLKRLARPRTGSR